MPTQSEIERTLVLLYRSNNASDHVNYTRPVGWLDKLQMAGLDELDGLLDRLKEDIAEETVRRMNRIAEKAIAQAHVEGTTDAGA